MASSYVMVIDTETTGLPPRNVPPWMLDAWSKCRVVQIAWEVYTEDGALVEEKNFIIYPDGFDISEKAASIHGITTEIARTKGVPMATAFEALEASLQSVTTIVAHNMSFDDSVIQSEMNRHKKYFLLSQWETKKKNCTMLMATKPGTRWPKLRDLYVRLFNREPAGTMHSADADVRACADIYFHMYRHGSAE